MTLWNSSILFSTEWSAFVVVLTQLVENTDAMNMFWIYSYKLYIAIRAKKFRAAFILGNIKHTSAYQIIPQHYRQVDSKEDKIIHIAKR